MEMNRTFLLVRDLSEFLMLLEDWLGHSVTVTSCLALQPTHWHLPLCLSPDQS